MDKRLELQILQLKRDLQIALDHFKADAPPACYAKIERGRKRLEAAIIDCEVILNDNKK